MNVNHLRASVLVESGHAGGFPPPTGNRGSSGQGRVDGRSLTAAVADSDRVSQATALAEPRPRRGSVRFWYSPHMSDLSFRLAVPADHPYLRRMIVDSFEPITWFKKIDEKLGPLNGVGWRERWDARLDKVFTMQVILVGELDGSIAAAATGTLDPQTALGFIDLLAVDQSHQGKGYGRAMLRGMLDYFRSQGMQHANLECLTDNDRGNALYASEGWEIVASSHRWFIRLE